MCAAQVQLWLATPDFIRPYVKSKGDNGMQRPMLSDPMYVVQVG